MGIYIKSNINVPLREQRILNYVNFLACSLLASDWFKENQLLSQLTHAHNRDTVPLKGGDIYAYGLVIQWPLVVSSGTYTAVVLAEPVLSACSPLPVNAFNIIDIPILASRVPKNPPCGVLVGLLTN